MSKNKIQDDVIQMTQASYDELAQELEVRKTTQRAEIAAEITEARELGDLSENHAYTVAMEKKDQNENRISDLEELMKNVQIVADSTSNTIVTIGKTVELVNLANKQKRVVILVGSEETEAADPTSGKVSVDSPIGQAIYNAKVGEEVEVSLPMGAVKYKIDKIK